MSDTSRIIHGMNSWCHYLHYIGVDDVLLRKQPVLDLLGAHDGNQVELTQVLVQQAVNRWDVLYSHRLQA